ncbi:hypothetical protein HaLaN_10017 [Haematococcus lacustris]|uniref:Uncharacterized protein n=1 Tax=Haematococcus lacustris TaxID=44745 RepID=A0A699YV40_HAELA|nr:hypothetical protein HaLaN_10017 [Haematococcus lacustris]
MWYACCQRTSPPCPTGVVVRDGRTEPGPKDCEAPCVVEADVGSRLATGGKHFCTTSHPSAPTAGRHSRRGCTLTESRPA